MDKVAITADGPSKEICLIQQGGGALGAYLCGSYEAVFDAGIDPDLVAGISIGALTGAIVAGNKPEVRVARLREFWRLITRVSCPTGFISPWLQAANYQSGVFAASAFGQPNFFRPWGLASMFAKPGTPQATSLYDTSPLRETLLGLVDFDLINSQKTRFLIGAVDVDSGDMVFFDNTKEQITVDHVMASGALPPWFPAVEINGRLYYDGGCVSNNAVDVVLESSEKDKLVLMPTLFSPPKSRPQDMLDAEAWRKNMQYAQKSAKHIERILEIQRMKKMLDSKAATLEFVNPIYQPPQSEGPQGDCDFTRSTIERRWQSGKNDMAQMLKQRGLCA